MRGDSRQKLPVANTYCFLRNTRVGSLTRTVLITALDLVWAEDLGDLNGCHKRAIGVQHEC